MKTFYLTFLLLMCSICYAQSNDFKVITEEISIQDERIYELTVKINDTSEYYKDKYKIELLIDNDISQLPKTDYETLPFEKQTATAKRGNHTLLIKFKNLSGIANKKKLFIKINIYEGDKIIKTDSSSQVILLNEGLINYSYLGYVGTNFDLVDGLKANNLFFASNIYVSPQKKKVGFYLSLYGNRTVSVNDSIKDVKRRREVTITDTLGNSFSIYEKSDLKRNMQTDNLGAYLSALVRLNNITSETEIFYSPSLEFIWRRNIIELSYNTPVVMDTIFNETGLVRRDIGAYNLTYNQTIKKNSFDFNLGLLGFLINHENNRISVRISMNTGVSFRNLPIGNIQFTDQQIFRKETDLFFTGRAWITERKSGITLQAEVYNTYINTSPYYGVTLSKAFDFENLGNFFSPISSRK